MIRCLLSWPLTERVVVLLWAQVAADEQAKIRAVKVRLKLVQQVGLLREKQATQQVGHWLATATARISGQMWQPWGCGDRNLLLTMVLCSFL